MSAQSGLLNTYAYTPANTDVVTASVTLAGCTGASAPIAMIVNALPVGSTVASSNPTSCGAADGSIQVAGGASYLWSDGQITATASALVQGAYTVDITSASGCVTTYAPAALSDPGAPAAVLASNDADNTCLLYTSRAAMREDPDIIFV